MIIVNFSLYLQIKTDSIIANQSAISFDCVSSFSCPYLSTHRQIFKHRRNCPTL